MQVVQGLYSDSRVPAGLLNHSKQCFPMSPPPSHLRKYNDSLFIAHWIKQKYHCLTYEAVHHRVLLAFLTHLPITQQWELPWSSVSLVTPLPMRPSTADSEAKFLLDWGSYQCLLNWIRASNLYSLETVHVVSEPIKNSQICQESQDPSGGLMGFCC